MNLFYESSTRTLASFELAAKRLSADTMTLRSSGSSVDKGESLRDTALTLAAYDPDVVVVRHPQIGAAQLVASATDAHVVNAGDGKHQHPTQALLDLFTIRERPRPSRRRLGRDRRGRPALARGALARRGAAPRRRGAALVGPPTLLPRESRRSGRRSATRSRPLADVDVVYVLRMQSERMQAGASSPRSASTPRSTASRRTEFAPGRS